jgi:hypothetical protein
MTKTLLALALALTSTAGLGAATPAAAQQVKPVCTDSSRACLIKTAQIYFDGLGRHDPSKIPFAPDVRCTEQGLVPVTNEAVFRSEIAGSKAITGVRNVRLFADPVTSSVGAFLLIDVDAITTGDKTEPPYTVRRGQRLKIVKGLITEVEIFNYVDPAQKGLAAPLWPE